MRATKKIFAAVVFALTTLTPSVSAYELTGLKWREPKATFMVGRLQAPWRDAFATAGNRWNEFTVFNWSTNGGRGNGRCRIGLGDNIAGFDSTVCGYAYGAATLAATLTVYETATLLIVRNDIFFNPAFTWQLYDGPLQPSGPDFKRVVAHELGHAKGLDHNNNSKTLMYRFISDIYFPRPDDIAGVSAIYGPKTYPMTSILPIIELLLTE